MTRVAKLSRRQVWEGGRVDLVRLPDWAVTLICGEDLAELRPCPSAEVVFVNKEIDDRPMIYRLSTCVDAAGRTVALKDGESYLWMINPFDPRAVFVCDVWGGYVGKCLRIDQIDRANLKEIGEEIGRTRRELDTALAPLARRSAVAARQMIGDMAANAALLRHGNADAVALIERDRAVSGERKAAIRGVTLDDLCGPVAGAGEGNEGAGLDALL
jgi:hypothetical protein